MSDKIRFVDYYILNGVFTGKVIIDSDECAGVSSFYLKDKRRNNVVNEVKFDKYENDSSYYSITVDLSPDSIIGGTWYPVVVFDDGRESFCYYLDRENENSFNIMLELGMDKLSFDANKKIHYMCVIDDDNLFAIRKWKNSVTFIKKNPLIISKFVRKGFYVEFFLKERIDNYVNQAEIWLWSRALKRVCRLCVSESDINDGHFKVNFAEFLEENSESYGRLWEIFLVLNQEGIYYQSRIEYRGNSLDGSKKVKKTDTDESDRYALSEPVIKNGEFNWTYQIYFDQLSQLCCKLVDRKLMYKGMYRAQIIGFSLKNSILSMTIFRHQDTFDNSRLLLRYKNTDGKDRIDEYEFKKIESKVTKDGIVDTFCIDYRDVDWTPLRYDLILLGNKDDFWYEFRIVGRDDSFYQRISNMYKYSYLTDNGILVYLTETLGQKLVIECRKKSIYDTFKYRVNESIAVKLYPFIKYFLKKKKYLLFYEKFCTAAQDNSYYMFEYFMEHKDEQVKPLYIIEKTQEKYKELKAEYSSNIIPFMSIKHLVYLQAASIFVSTDSKRHCYRWRSGNTKIMQMLPKKKFVFLQHGVLGFKRVDDIYGKQFANKADLFIASSDFEMDIIKRWFGYSEKDIAITGLARWDKLKSDPQNTPMIFYMPTWRNWVYEVSEEEFLQTDYFKAYYEILNSKELDNILKKYNMKLVFCLHPKFRPYLHCLKCDSSNIKIFDFDECNINEMLMKCSAFITDYSSTSWDVYYMKKPVIFYQFDYKKYIEMQGSYINLEKEIFGCRTTEFNEFISALSECAAGGFKISEQSDAVINKYLPFRDGKHRERIYSCIMKMLK